MTSSKQKQMNLEKLVDELIKDEPNRQMVKQLSKELGISYSVDPLTQMNTVLMSMNSVYLPPAKKTELEQ
ncbi:hypothetical protein D3C72_1639680 [compost metagenome]